MKTKFCLALTFGAGLAACHLQAQGTLSATATITETGMSGSEYEYSLVLDNTGSNPIDALWYGWTRGSFNLPSTPTSIAGPSGWTGTVDNGTSVQFSDSSITAANAIAPGGSATFTFDSTSSPTLLTSGTTDGDPTGESVAYSTVAGMQSFDQSDPGKASAPFQPSLATVPEPSTLGLIVTGLAGMSAWLCKRRSVA